MDYTRTDWGNRQADRADLTMFVTHLTRGQSIQGDDLSPVQTLKKILEERRIKGSLNEEGQGYIVGNTPAACFQGAPLPAVAKNVYYEHERKGENRYTGNGISFLKDYVYNKGGRPVIYEDKKDAKRFVDEEEWWRIVSLDLSDDNSIVDWTHEREWRVPGDFEFDLKNALVILEDRLSYQEFTRIVPEEIKSNLRGITSMSPSFW